MKTSNNPDGRPSGYNQEIVDKICSRIAEGRSLRSICRDDEDIPVESAVYAWLAKHDEFKEKYARAREAQMDVMAEEILEIADDGSNDWMERNQGDNTAWVQNGEAMQRSRLRVDSRKWLMSKLAPKKYGDKLTAEVGGHGGGPIETREVEGSKLALALLAVLHKPAEEK